MKMRKITLLVLLVMAFGGGSVASAVPITNGLVAAYEFNGNADDVSGNGNNGVVNGATLTTDRFGNPDSAYAFDGVDDYISIATDSSVLGGLPDFSLSLWLAPGDPIYGMFFQTPNGNIVGGIDTVTVEIKADRYGGAPSSPSTSISHYGTGLAFSPNEWKHLVFVANANNSASLYVDGSPITFSSSLTDGGVVSNTDATIIGAGFLSNRSPQLESFTNGKIDDAYLYDRALSASEIQTLYSAIPEPSTAILIGIGLSALAVRREKR